VTFLDFVVGYLIVLPVTAYVTHLPMLVGIFVAFAIFLYSGLYILNDLIDLREDRRHPIKRERPLASGAVRPASASMIAILLIVLGLALGYWIGPVVLVFEGGFIFINLLYSIVLKHIPFLDLFGNTVTHPMRTMFAICVFGQLETRHWPIISAISIIWLLFVAQKRYKELGEEGSALRVSLRRYSRGGLFALMIVGYLTPFASRQAIIILRASSDESRLC
jgi:4-hydroxybenzoate polyprenyltransferase